MIRVPRRWGGSAALGAALSAILALAHPAQAVEPDEILPDPALEARARAISAGLRCLVCQNQSIDDSAAPLARDLRVIVREHLRAGDTDDGIRAYLVERYGDFVLLKPPFETSTLLLWLTPVVVVLVGGGAALVGRRSAERASPLSADERARLAALIGSDGNEGSAGDTGRP